MTAWLPRAEALAVLGARPARLPSVLTPFPVPVVLGPGIVMTLMVPLGWN